MSKKIVFVQKDQGSYDPVLAFFNKKHQPNVKTVSSSIKTPSVAKQPKNATSKLPPKQQKSSNIQTKQLETIKSAQKEEIPSTGQKAYLSRQEALKTRDLSRTNMKKDSKMIAPNTASKKQIKQQEKIECQIKEDSLEKMWREETQKVLPKSQTPKIPVKNGELNKKTNQFQLREEEYIRKIEELQAKEEKYVKNQQKMLKLQKDYKAAVQKSKQGEGALQKLKQKEMQLKEILEGKSIPFSRKRQVILSNKLKELKRVNRQLVLRLKSYKGTDLVELSMQQNREEIMKDLYTVDVENQLNQQMNVEMESMVSQLAQKLQRYIQKRIKEKGERIPWNQQQSWLIELMNLSEHISLSYIDKYQICPLPKTNEEAISAYSILEQYKHNNQTQSIMDRFNLNLAFSKENSQIVDQLNQIDEQSLSLKSEIIKPKRKQEIDKTKMAEYIRFLQRTSSLKQILLIQSMCHQELVKEWIWKVHSRLTEELTSISVALGEIKDIVGVGESGKESLYYYLSNNLAVLQTRFPDLKLTLRQIKLDFKELQRLGPSSSKAI